MKSSWLLVVVACAAHVITARDCKKQEDDYFETAEDLKECDTLKGDLEITANTPMDALVGVQRVLGNIYIKGAVDVQVPDLAVVYGDIRMEGTVTASIRMPKLRMVQILALADNSNGKKALADIQFPSLQHAHTIRLQYLQLLTNVSFPSLVTVQDDILISKTKGLKEFSAPKLTSTNNLKVTDNKDLIKLYLDVVSTIQKEIKFENNKKLSKISLPQVTTFEDMEVKKNTRLKTVSLPNLQYTRIRGSSTDIEFIGNPMLRKVKLPNLVRSEGDIIIVNNNELVEVSFPKLHYVDYCSYKIAIHQNQKLALVNFPELISIAKVQVENNSALTSARFPLLEYACSFTRGALYPSVKVDQNGAVDAKTFEMTSFPKVPSKNYRLV